MIKLYNTRVVGVDYLGTSVVVAKMKMRKEAVENNYDGGLRFVLTSIGEEQGTIKFDIDFDRFDPAKRIKVDTEKQAALRNVEVDKTSKTATKYLIDVEKNLLKTQLEDKVEKTVNNVEDLIA